MWIEEGKSWEKMDNSKVAAVLEYQDKQGIKLLGKAQKEFCFLHSLSCSDLIFAPFNESLMDQTGPQKGGTKLSIFCLLKPPSHISSQSHHTP